MKQTEDEGSNTPSKKEFWTRGRIAMCILFLAALTLLVYVLFCSVRKSPVPEIEEDEATTLLLSFLGSSWEYDRMAGAELPAEFEGIEFQRLVFSGLPDKHGEVQGLRLFPLYFYLIDDTLALPFAGSATYDKETKCLVAYLPNGNKMKLLHAASRNGLSETLSLVGKDNLRVFYIPKNQSK
ncbi:MAG: hypothetical protein LKE40_12765 [Spirochaetia bacterium]|jgi:hypothetical protein|nr:hypothetical protein [Spirochaetia bacterium]MCH3918301.1 hypothetical protein [Spirochaetia bacterium]